MPVSLTNSTRRFHLLRFLKIHPYNNLERFKNDLNVKPRNQYSSTPENSDGERLDPEEDNEKKLKNVRALLKKTMLRRKITSKIDEKAIIELPEKSIIFHKITFTSQEAAFYHYWEGQVKRELKILEENIFLKSGTLVNHEARCFELLLRLRQICCHPFLLPKDFRDQDMVGEDVEDDDETDDLYIDGDFTPALNRLDDVMIESILAAIANASQCPKCDDLMVPAETSILLRCGHACCRECVLPERNPNLMVMFNDGEARDVAECPTCSSIVDSKESIIDLGIFKAWCRENDKIPKKKKYIRHDVLDGRGFHSSSKVKKCVDILCQIAAEGKEKTIVFSQITKMLDLIELAMEKCGVKLPFIRYDGKMSAAQRQQAIEKFNTRDRLKILLVSTKAGNSGLNLTVAS